MGSDRTALAVVMRSPSASSKRQCANKKVAKLTLKFLNCSGVLLRFLVSLKYWRDPREFFPKYSRVAETRNFSAFASLYNILCKDLQQDAAAATWLLAL